MIFLALLPFLPAALAQKPTLQVAAAADLAGIQQPLARAFEKLTGIPVKVTLGASGALARQIMEGVPYDVFLSDNERYVRDLISAKRADYQDSQVYGIGRLALWSKTRKLTGWEDLTKPEIASFVLPDPTTEPYGKAAMQSMTHLHIWSAIEKKAIYSGNVRQAMETIERGKADVAIVAWSEVYDKGGILLPDNLHPPLRQSATMMNRGSHQASAAKFLEFLKTKEAQSILQAHGVMENTGRAF